jgi:hypothetical protein
LHPNHQKPVSRGNGGFASAILNPSSSNLISPFMMFFDSFTVFGITDYFTVKKVVDFPALSCNITNQTISLAGNKLIIPNQGEFG